MQEVAQHIKAIVGALAGIGEQIPSLALWVLAGVLVYYLAPIVSIYGLVRLAINKFSHGYELKKTTEKQVEVESKMTKVGDYKNYFIGSAHIKFKEFLETLIADNGTIYNERHGGWRHTYKSEYIHDEHIDFVIQAYKLKKDLNNIAVQKGIDPRDLTDMLVKFINNPERYHTPARPMNTPDTGHRVSSTATGPRN